MLRNYFNFELVSLEVNDYVKNRNMDFGATNVYTNEKCRLRWAYIHVKVLFSFIFIMVLIEETKQRHQIQPNKARPTIKTSKLNR